ncbi:uncharacterized protein B0H18DRAFT_1087984 [Fomitopsis serialis]|uniref:uncharacterized protein n=1 Tax=Fomitopsis serialis TaxID=139415 RepID=UPI0020084920|nr:uncharacterized protein B0H18DRAFT_1087984 [Neoantrodia serialis]KAH9913736.1 hypothetical protein B0H18DRAFT_1087984 [Neoantrodia serialis]
MTRKPAFKVRPPPPLKQQRLLVPARRARDERQAAEKKECKVVLKAIRKLLKSKHELLEAGTNGLQSYCARAIQACLKMNVERGRKLISASEIAAEGNGFSGQWGSRLVCTWVRAWIKDHKLPRSVIGKHVKSFSLLSDPSIRAKMRSYKLTNFSQNKMVPVVATEYLKDIMSKEIPQGLKKYLELELFPRIHWKPGNGITLHTAHCWLHHEAAQANDGEKKGWVFQDEYPLKKKGQGCGVHQSEVICSTYGWLRKASQTLEYSKNHEGYWTGELFVKQLKEKIIPTFERQHGAGHRMLLIVDNSQGHSAYAVDALLTSRMNLREGGKQAHLRDGCQCQMTFPPGHNKYAGQPKGMKQCYLREHCDYTFDTLQANMPKAMASVDIRTICLWEHHMIRWMELYRLGMGAKDAQLHIKQFSSRQYKSHRRVPESLACQFDTAPT